MSLSAKVSTVFVSGKCSVRPAGHATWYCEAGDRPEGDLGVRGSKFASLKRHHELEENPEEAQRCLGG